MDTSVIVTYKPYDPLFWTAYGLFWLTVFILIGVWIRKCVMKRKIRKNQRAVRAEMIILEKEDTQVLY